MTAVSTAAPAGRQADTVSTFLAATYLGTGLPVIGVGVLATHVGLLTAVEGFAVTLIGLAALLLVVLSLGGRRTAGPVTSAAGRRGGS